MSESKIYNRIEQDPTDVEELDDGCIRLLYELNMNEELEDLVDSLKEAFTNRHERKCEWLNTPHPSLDGMTPYYCLLAGQVDKVIMILDDMECHF